MSVTEKKIKSNQIWWWRELFDCGQHLGWDACVGSVYIFQKWFLSFASGFLLISFSSHSVCSLCPWEPSALWQTGTPLPVHMPPQHGSCEYSKTVQFEAQGRVARQILGWIVQPTSPTKICTAAPVLKVYFCCKCAATLTSTNNCWHCTRVICGLTVYFMFKHNPKMLLVKDIIFSCSHQVEQVLERITGLI